MATSVTGGLPWRRQQGARRQHFNVTSEIRSTKLHARCMGDYAKSDNTIDF
jgi:predicted alpha-1,6-mannanase (GH76 family)